MEKYRVREIQTGARSTCGEPTHVHADESRREHLEPQDLGTMDDTASQIEVLDVVRESCQNRHSVRIDCRERVFAGSDDRRVVFNRTERDGVDLDAALWVGGRAPNAAKYGKRFDDDQFLTTRACDLGALDAADSTTYEEQLTL